mmetsp:Transcript_13021/g.35491  ORF Transcript_13021/g.35491 Transcript_13021/m.35491 type:complete len:879 (-) Transcript_13021:87-2723(-)
MAPSVAVGSLKTESGLAKLDALLADRSYIAGGPKATEEDLARFAEIQRLPDRQTFPHVARWHRHLAGLRAQFPNGLADSNGAAGPSTRAAAPPRGEKKVLVIDCQAEKIAEIRVPAAVAPYMGAGATCMPGHTEASAGRYYITTAINYCNGWPHMGHAYEALTSDVFARFHRMMGKDVFYMTGSDEHGQKIAQTAEGENMTPIDICDRYALGFQALNQRLKVSNDFYVRTTSPQHKEVARSMWMKCKDRGDIYLDNYEGWYLVREERFITDQEATEWNFKDPGSGVPLKKMCEPSFFFRLSKYAAAVVKHIEDNEEFIQPAQYRGEILERLRGMEMRDLSVSRGSFDWGVPCPEDPVDGKPHVMYVWFDALCNYISGVDGTDKSKPLSRFWPADMHIIGKDISWFHAVIWPAMLMSSGEALPKSIVVHGFIAGPDGRKMSKTYGNVVDPHDLLDRFPCDSVRWYLCRESAFGDDIKFSEESMRLMHNSELCDNLGNLVNRAVALCGGAVPKCEKGLATLPFDLKKLRAETVDVYDKYRLSDGADLAIRACGATNKWIADLEPWKMKEEAQQPLKIATCRVLLEAVYVLAHFFAPYIPEAAGAIFKKIGAEPRPFGKLRDDFMNLTDGTPVTSGSVLYQVLDASVVTAAAAAAPVAEPQAKAEAKEAKGKGKGEAKATDKVEASGKAEAKADAGGKKKKKEPLAPDDPKQPVFSKLDIRVGKVVRAWHHPEADRLFCEEIDVGDPEGPRQVISGLREHYSLEEFQGRKLLAVCNMVPAKMRGVTSHGMVLCAKNLETKIVELLSVPDDVPVGTRVLPEGVRWSWQPVQNEAVKEYRVWELTAAELKTDANRVACFAGKPLVTEQGAKFLAPTLAGVEIG